MKKLKHGGNLRQMAERYQIDHGQWLDLSTGVNPYHYPIGDIPAVFFQHLPDSQEALLQAARRYYGCQSLLACSGSQQVIQIMPRLIAPIRVALPDSGYQEHAYRWQLAGHTPCWYDGYSPETLEALIVDEGVEVAVIINPNNPTTALISVEKILQWAGVMAERGGLLIVDEAFIDLTPVQSVAPFADRAGLMVLRSVGKFFGLAGIRVGFVLAETALLRRVEQELSPWQVSGPAEYLMIEALSDTPWQHANSQAINESKEMLAALLRQHLVSRIDDGGLFLSCRLEHDAALSLYEKLARRGIAIRWGVYNKRWAFVRFGLIRREDGANFLRLSQALAS
ncbi:L-threonine O-3-phosphate decarboxylase [Sinobacterium caligoides]|uniref:threonine-phosphate decarboxylase n=1 Tax=Sinobacterium caligoides TaxID=933926 RepID=A0A3N2DQN4_9GAMM|nr:threonine-phosphate decarboxylase CobD [Sinobacterium caligoides]ROS01919.1 L-threonine O-3-phosphate decarboxylase [Sinobacterium caligoides]